MAALRPDTHGGSDARGCTESERAQLIIITGLTLAVILVAVVLLLNTAIYTENLATRGVDAGGTEATEFREGTAADVTGLLTRANWSAPDATDDFEDDFDRYAETTAEHRTREGVLARIDGELTDGTYIAQEENRTLDPSDDYLDNSGTAGDEWTLVEDATRTRSYVLDLQVETELENVTQRESDAFRLHVESDDGDEWTLYVYQLENEDVTVMVESEDGTESWTGDGDDVSLDLTGGTIDGEREEPLAWAAGVEDDADDLTGRTTYTISYANGDTVSGTYEFILDTPDPAAEAGPDEPLYDDPTAGSPYAVEAVYDVNLEMRHHTPELRYEDQVRVAPGERDA
ncbi:DUF7261 family protein [Halorubrum vacuolatum]|uniref:Uncharacterized protein n=1 Tax=Halorubrum vacuolatum TaxID=63740 RepID=A0A238WXA1_HALVU|nr:hypothetical protein [Halorubrum vacuolatum]SNR51120.1 hypothetical protein SAMN06264855_11113 [Halorubrum vacuolatum]